MTSIQYWFLMMMVAWAVKTCAIKQEDRYWGFALAVLFLIFALCGVKA